MVSGMATLWTVTDMWEWLWQRSIQPLPWLKCTWFSMGQVVLCLVNCAGYSLQCSLHAPVPWWPCRGKGWSGGLLTNCCLLDTCWSELCGSHLQWCNWKTVAHSFMPYTLKIHLTSVCVCVKLNCLHADQLPWLLHLQRLEMSNFIAGLRVCCHLKVGGFHCEGVCGPGEIPLTWTSGDTRCPGNPAFATCDVPWCLNTSEEELDAYLWHVFSSACVCLCFSFVWM